jgi:hypothetical protein
VQVQVQAGEVQKWGSRAQAGKTSSLMRQCGEQ